MDFSNQLHILHLSLGWDRLADGIGRETTCLLTRRRPQHLLFALRARLAGGPGGGTPLQYWYAVDCSQSASLSLASRTVLVEELHRTPHTPSTATTQLRTLCLFRGQSWWRTYNQKGYPSLEG